MCTTPSSRKFPLLRAVLCPTRVDIRTSGQLKHDGHYSRIFSRGRRSYLVRGIMFGIGWEPTWAENSVNIGEQNVWKTHEMWCSIFTHCRFRIPFSHAEPSSALTEDLHRGSVVSLEDTLFGVASGKAKRNQKTKPQESQRETKEEPSILRLLGVPSEISPSRPEDRQQVGGREAAGGRGAQGRGTWGSHG